MAGERKIVADNLKRALLKEFVMKETARAGFGGLDIQRTPMGTRITLYAERPGIVIGRRGVSIKELTANVDRGFDLDNPQIEVEEVGNPAINAQIMAEKLSSALERGWHFRRAGHSTLRRIMASGAKGALIRLSGKLTSQRHRTEKFKAGHVKYNGEPKNLFVDQGFSTAKLKRGTIGVTVWITDPNAKLPDEIEVLDVEPPAEVQEAPSPEEGPPAEEPAPEPAKTPEVAPEARPPEVPKEMPEPEPEPQAPEPATKPGKPEAGPEPEAGAKSDEEVAPESVPPEAEAPSAVTSQEVVETEPEETSSKPAPKEAKAKAPAKKPAKKATPKKKAAAGEKKTASAKKGEAK
ncbi:MAG: 30S ribosomal protein S3 [Thermoplasmata archaeon]